MAGDEALVMTSLVLIMAIFLRRRRTFFRRMRLMALQTRRMRRNAVMLSIQQQNNINHRKRKTMWVYPRPQFWFEQLVVNTSALKQVWSWPRNWTINLCRRDCKSIETRIRIKVVSHFEP